MYILRTVDTLHDNPYTGDKITKARVFSFDPSSSPHGSTSSPHDSQPADQGENREPGQTNFETHAVDTPLPDSHIDEGQRNRRSHANEFSQGYPKFVAIKHLNNHKIDYGRSQDETPWNDDDVNDKDPIQASSKLEEWQRRRWPLISETKVPDKIEFGVSAKREIRALKAAQGHPNVRP